MHNLPVPSLVYTSLPKLAADRNKPLVSYQDNTVKAFNKFL